MSTTTHVVHGDALDPWIAERRRLGLDTRDEVWNGSTTWYRGLERRTVPWCLARAVREVWRIKPSYETVEIVNRDGLPDRSAGLDLGVLEIAGLLGRAQRQMGLMRRCRKRFVRSS